MKGLTIYSTVNQKFSQNSNKDPQTRLHNQIESSGRLKVFEKSSEAKKQGDLSSNTARLPRKKDDLMALTGNAPENSNFIILVNNNQEKSEPDNRLANDDGTLKVIEPRQMQRLINNFSENPDRRPTLPVKTRRKKSENIKLTETEIEILKLICYENTSKEIAEKVCLGRRTIEHYRRRILIKTDSPSPIALVKFALKNGFY